MRIGNCRGPLYLLGVWGIPIHLFPLGLGLSPSHLLYRENFICSRFRYVRHDLEYNLGMPIISLYDDSGDSINSAEKHQSFGNWWRNILSPSYLLGGTEAGNPSGSTIKLDVQASWIVQWSSSKAHMCYLRFCLTLSSMLSNKI